MKVYKSLDNLIQYFESNVNQKEDSECTVQMLGTFETEETVGASFEGLTPFSAYAYHDQKNLKGSAISEESFKKNTSSILFRPVLANVVENGNREMDFGGHDIGYEERDGEIFPHHFESPVGVITGYNFVFDQASNVTRALIKGFLFTEYCREVAGIMSRRRTVDCSVELSIREMHYSTEDRALYFDDYFISGLTLLGSDKKPGMAGSNLTIDTFSKEDIKSDYFENMDKTIVDYVREVEKKLFAAEESQEKKGEDTMDGKADEKNLTEEEVVEVVENETEEVVEETETEAQGEPEAEQEFSKEEAVTKALQEKLSEDVKFSIVALSENAVIFQKEDGETTQKIEYSINESGAVEFTSDILEVSCHWLTEEEVNEYKSELDEVKFQLNETETKLQEAQKQIADFEIEKTNKAKEEILSDPIYSELIDSEEFSLIKSKVNDLSVEELKTQAELALAKFARASFSATKQSVKKLAPAKDDSKKKKDSRYGNIFSKK